MSSNISEDISIIESKLREILAQLQCKTESLDKAQQQLFEAQDSNYQLQILLDNEKRVSKRVKQKDKKEIEELRDKLAVMEILQTGMDESTTISVDPIIEPDTNDYSEQLKLTADVDLKLNEICKKLLSTSFVEATNNTD